MLHATIFILNRLLVLATIASGGPNTMPDFTLKHVCSATGGHLSVSVRDEAPFDRVSVDSRAVRPGDLFWALSGKNHDGHDFAADAVTRGAVACVVGNVRSIPFGTPAVVVGDTLAALHDFARWHRRRSGALVAAVTGSVGKTTTREMIHRVLGARYEGCQSPMSFNNHVGLPLSVLQIEQRHSYAVLEMGASRLGEIRQLASIASPEIGVVTRIGVAHVQSFGSIETIAKAKGELIEALSKQGLAVLNGDDARCAALSSRASCRVLRIGQSAQCAIRATGVDASGARLRFRVDGAIFRVHAAGRHQVISALAAIAIGREVGLSTRQIAAGLDQFVPIAGRCRIVNIGPWTVIDDTYNANPTSMEAACDLLCQCSARRRVLVVGDMAELGEQSADWHRRLGRLAADRGIDKLVACGQFAKHVVRGAHEGGMSPDRLAACGEFDVLLAALESWTEPGDVLLVKGSRPMRMERVIDWFATRTGNTQENFSPRASTRACA